MPRKPPPPPSGPEYEALRSALHQLHRSAGFPTSRAVAAKLTLSHTTVADIMRGTRLPPWPTLEQIVTVLEGDQGHFYTLWAAAHSGRHAPDAPVALMKGRPGSMEYRQTYCLVDEIAATATELNQHGGWTLASVVPAPDHPDKMILIVSRRSS